MSHLIDALFNSKALDIAPADRPFWYTSGLFGPYYINTHFLAGGKERAQEILEAIERVSCPKERKTFSSVLIGILRETESAYEPYRLVLDRLTESARQFKPSAISGGERRDFFFSLPVAVRLGLPHLTIFKDGDVYLSGKEDEDDRPVKAFTGTSLHIADLVTEASSYLRTWIPSVRGTGALMSDTIAVVDRKQGGKAALLAEGIGLYSLVDISPDLFRAAAKRGQITPEQEAMLNTYYSAPDMFVSSFLSAHPGFLEEEELRDEKTAARVARLRALLDA
jgi:orotate phosphoribosyltransferase